VTANASDGRVVTERYISPARASQILSHTLGHGYSRQSVVRLLEAGVLVGHQMKARGRWWILSSSLSAYTQSIFRQNDIECGGVSHIAQLVTNTPRLQRQM
jgi:hypothetical protein